MSSETDISPDESRTSSSRHRYRSEAGKPFEQAADGSFLTNEEDWKSGSELKVVKAQSSSRSFQTNDDERSRSENGEPENKSLASIWTTLYHTYETISAPLIPVVNSIWFERFFLFATLAHNAISLARGEASNLVESSYIVEIVFASLYLLQIVLICLSLQLGNFLRCSICNRLDFVSAWFSLLEIAAWKNGVPFTLCSIRLFRVILPLTRHKEFQILDGILHVLNTGWASLGYVLLLIGFCFVLFGVVGIHAYSRSFERRCVWADSFELKIPEQFCKRYDDSWLDSDYGLNSNCGPFQLCRDVGNPNFGLTHFDNIGAAILALFQCFAGQKQYFIMWACLQSEPTYAAGTLTYFFLVTLVIAQVLGNLHTAGTLVEWLNFVTTVDAFLTVLVGIYCQVRQKLSDFPARFKSAVAIVLTPTGNEVVKGTFTNNTKLLDHFRTDYKASIKNVDGSDKEKGEVNPSDKIVNLHEKKPLLEISAELSKIFKKPWFEALGLAAVTTNEMAIFLRGSLGSTSSDKQLALVERYCGYYFVSEFTILTTCAGSLPAFFSESRYHAFEFAILCSTVAGLVSEYMGAPANIVAVVRTPSVFRLFRFLRSMSRWYPFDILWDIAQDCGRSILPVINLLILVLFLVLCFAVFFVQFFSGSEVTISDRLKPQSLRSSLIMIMYLFTGAGWADALYGTMGSACSVVQRQDFPGVETYDCRESYVALFAMVFILFFWVTQYLCVPFFLALILETFDLTKIMQYGQARLSDQHVMFDREEAKSFIAQYYGIRVQDVSKQLLDEAMEACLKGSTESRVTKKSLHDWLQYSRPHRIWRMCRAVGLILVLNMITRYICCCLCGWKCCSISFGPVDSAKDTKRGHKVGREEIAKAREDQKRQHLEKIAPKLREQMTKLVKMGMAGEVRIIAARMKLANQLPASIIDAEPEVALALLKDANLARRLGFQVPQDHDNHRNDGGSSSTKQAKKTGKVEKREGFFAKFRRNIGTPCRKICNNPTCDVIMYCSILCSCLFLLFQTPAAEIQPVIPQIVIDLAGYVFLLVLTSEVVLKIIGFGFFLAITPEHKPYWSRLWNRLDLLVMILNWLELLGFLGLGGRNTIQILRLAKCVELLCKLHFPSMRTMATAVISCTKPFLLVVSCLVFVVCVVSALGMSLFAGTFFSCSDTFVDGTILQGIAECSGTTVMNDFYVPRVWDRAPTTFDTFPLAMLAVCKIFSSNWIQDLYHASDSNRGEPGIQPVQDQNQGVAAIYYSFLIVSIRMLFLKAVFQSGVSDGYVRNDEISIALINKTILEYWPTFRKLPTNFVSRFLQEIIHSNSYIFFSTSIIMINIVFMSVEHAGESEAFQMVTMAGNDLGFTFFCIDVTMTVVALGRSGYLSSSRKWLDICLFISFIITLSTEPSGFLRPALQIILAIRLVRPLSELTKEYKGSILSVVFDVLNLSGAHIVSIIVLLFGGMAIFAVIGVMLFGNVKAGLRISAQANFRDFPSALLTLCQILIGDEWPVLMTDCSIQPPYCTERFFSSGRTLSYGDCGVSASPAYFLLFKIVCDFLIFHLLLGIIFETYLTCTSRRNLEIADADVRRFSKIWTQYFDPGATGFIPVRTVNRLLNSLPAPLGISVFISKRILYLCVRHELELIALGGETTGFLSNSATLSVYRYLRRLEARLWKPILEEWEITKAHFEIDKRNANIKQQSDEGAGESWTENLEEPQEGDERDGSASPTHVEISGGNFGKDHKKGRMKVDKKRKSQLSTKNVGRKPSVQQIVEAEPEKLKRKEGTNKFHRFYAYFLPDPRPSSILMIVTLLKKFVALLVPPSELRTRPDGHVRFDEVLKTIVYWSPDVQSVPRSLRSSRSEFDRTILQAVALQIVAGFCRGAGARAVLRRNLESEQDGYDEVARHSAEEELISGPLDVNDLRWLENAREWALREEECTDRGAMARIVARGMLSYEEICAACQELGLPCLDKNELFSENDKVSLLCQHETIAQLCANIRTIECAKRLVRAGYEKLLRMTAEGLGFDWHSLEDMTDLEVQALHSVLAQVDVQKKIIEVDGPDIKLALDDVDEFDQLSTAMVMVSDMEEEISKALVSRDELLKIVSETRARVQACEDETRLLAATSGLELAEFKQIRIQNKESPTRPPQSADSPKASEQLSSEPMLSQPQNESESRYSPSRDQGRFHLQANASDIVRPSAIAVPDDQDVARLRDAIAIKKAEIEHLGRDLRRVRALQQSSNAATTGEDDSEPAARPASPDRRTKDANRDGEEEVKGSAAAMGIDDSRGRRTNVKASKFGEKAAAMRDRAKRPAWL